MTNARLAVDIGGTFTDFALEHAGGRLTAKVLTTPSAPEEAVIAGTQSILAAAGLAAVDIDLLVHGTTLATNALVERKGAKTAFITTSGFRDVLAMGNESRYDQYDLAIRLPEPLVPRSLRLAVPERIDATGRVLLPLNERAVQALLPVLKDKDVQSVAIGFLHSFTNSVHERRARALLEASGLPISISSEVSPEMREWERFSTTVANAYVQPLMQGYLWRFEAGLRAIGVTAPILLMLSGGSLTTIDTACRFPIRLVESGPAGGAMFSAAIARAAGLDHVLSFDMGGTTAKICIIDHGRPQTSRSFEVARLGRFKKGSGLPLRIPVIEMIEIGAGGGSLARVDALGRIAVGPDSAGADPGPACFGRGGIAPAVTDANLALGRYDPARFAGGGLRLDPGAAKAALLTAIGEPLMLDAPSSAAGVVEMVDETMANAARIHGIESGKSFAGRTLIAFGGGGPVHATRLAEKIGIECVLVPPGAGVGSAIGFLRAPIGYEVVRSQYQRLATFDSNSVNALLDEMAAEAHSVVDRGRLGAAVTSTRVAFMRYVGQGHEIPVILPTEPLGPDAGSTLRAAFIQEYARFYDRPVPGSDVEALSYAVSVTTLPTDSAPDAPLTLRPAPIRTQIVVDPITGIAARWTVYERAALSPDTTLIGPAIVAEDETSTLIGPGWQGCITHAGIIMLTRAAAITADA